MAVDIFEDMNSKSSGPKDIFSDMGSDSHDVFGGNNPQKTTILQDIQKGASDIPSAVWNMAKELPGEAYGAGKQALTNPGRVGQNVLTGLAQMGHGVLNTPANIVDYLKKKEVLPDYIQAARQPEYDFASMAGRQGQQPGDALISGTAEYLPYLLGAGIGGAGRGAFANALRQSGASALSAVGQNENPVTAAGTMGIADLGARGLGGALRRASNLRPGDFTPSGIASRFGGELNPEMASELAKRLRAAEGTQTPLGDVIGSPTLKKTFENVVAPQALSGAEDAFTNIGEQIKSRANSIVQPGGDIPLNEQIHGALKQKFRDATTTKNDLYNQANELAKSEGIKLDLPSFRDYATENSQIIKSSPLLKTDSKIRKIYNKLIDYQKNSGEAPSIAEANLLANSLGAEGAKMVSPMNSATDRGVGRLYLGLRDNLKNDINGEISSKGSPELKNAYQKANDYYKNEFVNFLDKPDVAKFLETGKDPQNLINEIVQPGKSADKYTRIDKINEILDPSQRGKLGQAYLQKAIDNEGGLDPRNLNKQINALGPRQFNSLFPGESGRGIQDFQRLIGMNSEAMNRMSNPKTGARGMDIFSNALGFAGGNALGGPIGGLLGIGGTQALSRMLTKGATSEPFRNAAVNRKLQNFRESLQRQNSHHAIGQDPTLFLDSLAGALAPPNNANQNLIAY